MEAVDGCPEAGYQLGSDAAELVGPAGEVVGIDSSPEAAETFQRAGIDPSLGARLWAILQQAGLRPLGMVGVQPHFGPDDPAGSATPAGIVQTMLPLIERTGVATAQQVGIETLQARLAEEPAASQAVAAHPMLLSAWGTVG